MVAVTTYSPSMLKLPVEILEGIVEALLPVNWEHRDVVDIPNENTVNTLKALRLTCRRFSYLGTILKSLFQPLGIRLVASSDAVNRLLRTDLSALTPFVRRVTFVPPEYTWGLGLDDFKRAVWYATWRKDDEETREAARGQGKLFEDDEDEAMSDMAWEMKELAEDYYRDDDYEFWSERNQWIESIYTVYANRALAARHLLEGHTIRNAWTRALAVLSRIDDVRFVFTRHSIAKEVDTEDFRRFEELPHGHVGRPAGDALFETAVFCLAQARTVIRHLHIGCAMTSGASRYRPDCLDGVLVLRDSYKIPAQQDTLGMRWHTLPCWDELDLTQLETFFFRPLVLADNTDVADHDWYWLPDVWHTEDVREAAENAALAVSSVLVKSAQSLKLLDMEAVYCPLRWPPPAVVALPQLCLLRLGPDSKIPPTEFQDWVAQMPSLRCVTLPGSVCMGDQAAVHPSDAPPSISWKPVFDAIRAHPNNLHILMEGSDLFQTAFFTAEFDTSNPDGAFIQVDVDYTGHDIEEVVLYICGKTDWTARMDRTFRSINPNWTPGLLS